ncbi:sulfatase family protein [Maribellus mangrovi]|uniref:sulfatase family protein n=1 Tax=Maribellus mangrovi TaxID=3133146 RepID=UPI0030ECFD35
MLIKKILLGFGILSCVATWAQSKNDIGAKPSGLSGKPNVILLMADDLGWGDVGYNGNPVIKTPNLDKMAKEGVQFNRFYSACAVCSPTRASVLMGRNPYRTGVFTANVGILRPEEVTLPELLKEEDYATAHFGKWHLGTLTHTEKDANRGRPGNLKEYNPPAVHGYDYAFVTESKVPTWDPMKKPVAGATREGWDYLKEDEAYTDYGTHYWDINGNKVTENLDGDDSRVIMDRVVPFIEEASADGKPFFTVVWFHAPHLPVVAGPKYRDMYPDQDDYMKNYAGCITALDEQVGRLRDFLAEKGLAENTMIWFCSDNGPERDTPGSSGGFRDRKRSLHEGGVRVPGILVWPEAVKKHFETDIPFVTSDYLPTIMDVLDIDTGKTPNQLDGISILPLLEGKMQERPKPIGFCYGNQVAYSDNQYKVYAKSGTFTLYDLTNDPYEKSAVNLSDPSVFNGMKEGAINFVNSCKSSFEGDEYGTESYIRLDQNWKDPLKYNE